MNVNEIGSDRIGSYFKGFCDEYYDLNLDGITFGNLKILRYFCLKDKGDGVRLDRIITETTFDN